MTLQQQLAQLRTQHFELLQQQEGETQAKKSQHAIYMSNRADALMQDLYEELSAKINVSSGLGDSATLRLIASLYDTKDAAAVQKLVKERSGIEVVVKYPKSEDTEQCNLVRINLKSQTKVYTLPAETKTSGRRLEKLDFPALFAENERRNQVWQAELKTIATKAVDICCACLQAIEAPYYGLNGETALVVNERSAFSGYYQLNGQKLPYGHLTESQIAALAREMNALISGGEVKLWLATTSRTCVLHASITRQPHKIIETAYFDYEAFCQPYDKVTKPLQDIFDQIIQKLELKDIGAQIATLQPSRRLICRFEYRNENDPLNYAKVKRGLEGRQHLDSFITAINQALPAIQVLSIAFNTNNTTYYVGEIEIAYGIVDKEADFVKKQVAAEKAIKHIKRYSIRHFAHAIINVIMNDLEKVGLDHLFRANYPERSCYEIQQVEIATDLATSKNAEIYRTIINQIQDEQFIARVERTINRLTEGLILIDLQRSKYKLNFSPEVARATKPLTLAEYYDLMWNRP